MVPPWSIYNFSSDRAPIRKPCAICAGGKLKVGCANKNNFSAVVGVGSICKNSICCSSLITERGVIIDVMNPLSSLANASYLNPSASNEKVPKLEFEFVIDASAPFIISKCAWKPIANTDTI